MEGTCFDDGKFFCPCYLTMAKVRNISTKSYGINGVLRRYAGTRLTDPDHLFNFAYAGENEHEAFDPLEILHPGAEVPIHQTFEVTGGGRAYIPGRLKLDLILSDPQSEDSEKRSVVSYEIEMQISGAYKHDSHSSFLLVVNSQVPNAVVHQIQRFVGNELGLCLDTFNLSVSGSFVHPTTQRNVLSDYEGKSVIIFGNQFPYFGLGNRFAFDLLDPWLVCKLAKCGTGFYFTSVNSLDRVRTWGSLLTFPVYPLDVNESAPGSVHAQSLKETVMELRSADTTGLNIALPTHSFPLKKRFLRNLNETSASDSEKTAKEMKKHFPLYRYAVTVVRPRATNWTNSTSGSIVVREGLPKTANIFSTLRAHGEGNGDIMHYHMYMIVSSLPFKTRTSMFWNLLGSLRRSPTASSYHGKDLEQIDSGVAVSVREQSAISKRVGSLSPT